MKEKYKSMAIPKHQRQRFAGVMIIVLDPFYRAYKSLKILNYIEKCFKMKME